MSNRKKLLEGSTRSEPLRPGRGRHRAPSRAGYLIAAPGQAGVKVLAAGALGSAAVMAMSAGAGSAATAAGPVAATLTASTKPAPVSVNSVMVGVGNNGPFGSIGVQTPFGGATLNSPKVTPFQPVQFQFDPKAAAAAVAADPVYQNLAQGLSESANQQLYQAANQQVADSLAQIRSIQFGSAPASSFGPTAPFNTYGLPTGTTDVTGTGTSPGGGTSFGPTAPVPLYDIPSVPPPPASGSIVGSAGFAAGVGMNAGGSCDSNGCALTLGALLGFGGSVRAGVSPNPTPTTVSADWQAQVSGGVGPLSGTVGVNGSFTDPNGIQVFGRTGLPGTPLQGTVSDAIPASTLWQTLAQMGNQYTAAQAGMTVEQMLGPPSPNEQVAQGFSDLTSNGGSGLTFVPGARLYSFGGQTTVGASVTIPLTRDYLNQVGQALGSADMATADSFAQPATTAQPTDQTFVPPSTLNNVNPLTYQAPGGQFPPVPNSVVNTEFQQLQTPVTPDYQGYLNAISTGTAVNGGVAPVAPSALPSTPVPSAPSATPAAPADTPAAPSATPTAPSATPPGPSGSNATPGQGDPAAAGNTAGAPNPAVTSVGPTIPADQVAAANSEVTNPQLGSGSPAGSSTTDGSSATGGTQVASIDPTASLPAPISSPSPTPSAGAGVSGGAGGGVYAGSFGGGASGSA